MSNILDKLASGEVTPANSNSPQQQPVQQPAAVEPTQQPAEPVQTQAQTTEQPVQQQETTTANQEQPYQQEGNTPSEAQVDGNQPTSVESQEQSTTANDTLSACIFNPSSVTVVSLERSLQSANRLFLYLVSSLSLRCQPFVSTTKTRLNPLPFDLSVKIKSAKTRDFRQPWTK